NGDALTAATALDSFCIDVDKTIGFHLVHGENGAFTGTKLRGLAEAQGFTLSTDGLFRYYNSGESSFVMFNSEDNPFSAEMLRASVVKGVTFQFDIPHIKQCTQSFGQMVQVARQMEIGLNAVLVDDNNKVLGDMQIEKIRQQLKVIHATMLVRGIIPGSDSALRLFS
ncbi:MAG: cell division protein ZipA C-terminal FtsZ-binding domain-containing protein, partial [Methylotenera sp.]